MLLFLIWRWHYEKDKRSRKCNHSFYRNAYGSFRCIPPHAQMCAGPRLRCSDSIALNIYRQHDNALRSKHHLPRVRHLGKSEYDTPENRSCHDIYPDSRLLHPDLSHSTQGKNRNHTFINCVGNRYFGHYI